MIMKMIQVAIWIQATKPASHQLPWDRQTQLRAAALRAAALRAEAVAAALGTLESTA